MKLEGFFREKVQLPIWPLIPLLLVGLCIPLPSCDRLAGIAGIYATIGFIAVAIRYWWAWIQGAPRFDWIVLILLCPSMGILARLFVNLVGAFV